MHCLRDTEGYVRPGSQQRPPLEQCLIYSNKNAGDSHIGQRPGEITEEVGSESGDGNQQIIDETLTLSLSDAVDLPPAVGSKNPPLDPFTWPG